MDLYWVNRSLVVARIGQQVISLGGEALRGGKPDFVIFSEYVTHWEDGTPLTPHEKRNLLAEVVSEATRQGWSFEIE